jgi:curved DNA-binding protein CbpA
MALKDYYGILELGPQASDRDIKKAYRRLAMTYHPDKHPEDPVAAAYFREIQEAYDTLTNPDKKDAYLQKRWYEKSVGRRMSSMNPLTSVNILKDILHLDKYISRQDPYHIDRSGLLNHLLQILSPEAVEGLKTEADRNITHEILLTALRCAKPLEFEQAATLTQRLALFCREEDKGIHELHEYMSDKSRKKQWDNVRIPLILTTSLIICYLIYRVAK